MTHIEILEKAIRKALDNKWVGEWNDPGVLNPKTVLDWYEVGSISSNFDNYKLFIFNHDFAKALWGYKGVKRPAIVDASSVYDCGHLQAPTITKQAWQYHLQNMVISDDPIAYLGANT